MLEAPQQQQFPVQDISPVFPGEGPQPISADTQYQVGDQIVSGQELSQRLAQPANDSQTDSLRQTIDGLQNQISQLQQQQPPVPAVEEAEQSAEQETRPSNLVDFFQKNFNEENAHETMTRGEMRDLLLQFGDASNQDVTQFVQETQANPENFKPVFDHHFNDLTQQHQANEGKAAQVQESFKNFVAKRSSETGRNPESVEATYKEALNRVLGDQAYALEGSDPAAILQKELDHTDKILSTQEQPSAEAETQPAPASLNAGRRFRTSLPEARQRYASEDEARRAFREGMKKVQQFSP